MTSPSPSADTIFLRGLSVECTIGFLDWERRVKQTVEIDLELPVDCRNASIRDEVEDTLDYNEVAKRVIAFVELSEYKLIETLAQRLALLVLEEFGIAWIRLSVHKPSALRGSQDVGVSIERTRADLPQSATR